jgi:hypothetical protein
MNINDQNESMYQKAEMYVISTGTGSWQSCPKGRAVVGNGLVLSTDLKADESLCVSTSKGAWAVVDIPPGHRNEGVLNLTVTLYTKPKP